MRKIQIQLRGFAKCYIWSEVLYDYETDNQKKTDEHLDSLEMWRRKIKVKWTDEVLMRIGKERQLIGVILDGAYTV